MVKYYRNRRFQRRRTRRARSTRLSRRRNARPYRRSRRRGIMRIPKSIIPKKTIVTLPYVSNQTFSLTAANGYFVSNHWRTNSIADPNHTGAGHQPLGHDQWEMFYTKYTVLSSRISVIIDFQGSPGVTGNFVGGVCLVPAQEISDFDTLESQTLQENPRVNWRRIGKGANTNIMRPIRNGYNMRRYFAGTGDMSTQREHFGSSPTDQHTAVFSVFITDGTQSQEQDFRVTTKIWYTVLMDQPIDLFKSPI